MKVLIFALSVMVCQSIACGPWFPDTALDDPQGILKSIPVCYEDELASVLGQPLANDNPLESIYLRHAEIPLAGQIPLEQSEVKRLWKEAGMSEADVEKFGDSYGKYRFRQLAQIEYMGFSGRDLGIKDKFENSNKVDMEFQMVLPADILAYLEGVDHLLNKRRDEARAKWKALLELPSSKRKNRSAWAVWMLAKTSPTDEEALQWYTRVPEEVKAGASDVLGLAPAADCWRASRLNDPVQGLRMYANAYKEGKRDTIIDIRRKARQILETENSPESRLEECAKDRELAQILNVEIFASLDGDNYLQSNDDKPAPFPYARWLQVLEKQELKEFPKAERIAWALYSWGDYPASKRWLALANPTDSKSRWLEAKFAMREGKLAPATRLMEKAVKSELGSEFWKPSNVVETNLWQDTIGRRSEMQGKLLVDMARLHMARGEFLRALQCFQDAEYFQDAAYIAEYILSSDELLSYVKARHRNWSPDTKKMWSGNAEDGEKPEIISADAVEFNGVVQVSTGGDELRYLLGRRLAREFRFREAREYMPDPVIPLFDRFVVLHRAAISGKWSGRDLAGIRWHLAKVRRGLGMELFGYEGSPDGNYYAGGLFEMSNFRVLRIQREGWKTLWQTYDEAESGPTLTQTLDPSRLAIPKVAVEEISRLNKYSSVPLKRFHYRYIAAEEAWQAASSLPDNDHAQAYILNTAGKWISNRDPEAADKYYKALVNRNLNTPIGQAADKKRWFISMEEPPNMPAIPEGL